MEEPIDFNKLKNLKEKIRAENKDKYLENSKKRLEKIISTKIRTSFIGAISTFEEAFGFLWGHDNPDNLTEEEEIMKEVWEKARTSILNNGNNQIRSVKNEIECNTVHWNRYSVSIPVQQQQEEEKEN